MTATRDDQTQLKLAPAKQQLSKIDKIYGNRSTHLELVFSDRTDRPAEIV